MGHLEAQPGTGPSAFVRLANSGTRGSLVFRDVLWRTGTDIFAWPIRQGSVGHLHQSAGSWHLLHRGYTGRVCAFGAAVGEPDFFADDRGVACNRRPQIAGSAL